MDKVMWGTDWPVQELAQSIGEVRALDLSDTAKEKILGENAIRILGLRPPLN
jgi:predicted TIM-barrel fold metal-dependent hydrolase